MSDKGRNRVRELRKARGLSQRALAAAANLTRQSIGAIEAGRAVPAVDVALRISRALGFSAEELFGGGFEEPLVSTVPFETPRSGRVALAWIGGRSVSFPLDSSAIGTAADGLVERAAKGALAIRPIRPLAETRENLVVMGCASALGLLSARLNEARGPGRFLWVERSSAASLAALAQGKAHLGGIHFPRAETDEADLAALRRSTAKTPLVVVALAHWEEGLVTAAGNPKKIRGGGDLGRPGIRLVSRERGSGAQRVLERELRRAFLRFPPAQSGTIRARGHFDVARAVAMGAADAGVASRDAALAFGLGFVPLAEERYDLVIPLALFEDRRVERLLDVMTSLAYRRELSALGYDVRATGSIVARLHAR
jgi:molybdate-binding protein/DNA-binding XRE family transcriptional regulator